MELGNLVGWSVGLMVLSIVVTAVVPTASTIMFAMMLIGAAMVWLVVGVLREDAPAVQKASMEKNYRPQPEVDDNPMQ